MVASGLCILYHTLSFYSSQNKMVIQDKEVKI